VDFIGLVAHLVTLEALGHYIRVARRGAKGRQKVHMRKVESEVVVSPDLSGTLARADYPGAAIISQEPG
jgi:hypothetical protein